MTPGIRPYARCHWYQGEAIEVTGDGTEVVCNVNAELAIAQLHLIWAVIAQQRLHRRSFVEDRANSSLLIKSAVVAY
eukprot:COSAG02_NODE_153_length_33128_cov_10.471253_21_plen_77_part_00